MITEFYHKNLNVFGGLKIAILTSDPMDYIIPLLVKNEDKGYESSPFTNIENQKKLEMQLEALNESLYDAFTVYNSKIDSLEELKKSILQKAFAGELTEKDVVL